MLARVCRAQYKWTVAMSGSHKRVVVLWTGGKDSCLALFRALESKMHVCALATFVPGADARFKAHPLEMMQRQAKELGVHHELIPVSSPYRPSYEDGLARIRTLFRADAVVTGDIAEVAGFPNWISQCSSSVTLDTIRPLWHEPRRSLLREIVGRKIRAQISWISDPHLPSDWVGRYVNDAFIEDITNVAKTVDIDICGENGEYHTMVWNLPRITSGNWRRPLSTQPRFTRISHPCSRSTT
jgi:diphthine-ammonia ligase